VRVVLVRGGGTMLNLRRLSKPRAETANRNKSQFGGYREHFSNAYR